MPPIELSDKQRIELGHESTEVTTDELQALINAKGEQWKSTDAGKAIIALLQKKNTAQAGVNDTAQKALEEQQKEITRLQAENKRLLENGGKEISKKDPKKEIENMRAEGYTDLYILSRLMANGILSAEKIQTDSKILKSIFGWNIIPVYNAMAYMTGKSTEWSGK